MRKKILSIILFLCLICSNFPVYATNTVTESTANKVATTTVTAQVSSNFSVTIPKSITLTKDSTSKKHTQSYTITTSGDIAGNETLTVAPQSYKGYTGEDTKIKLSTTGKTDVTATVKQTKITWSYSEISTGTTGTITTDVELSSGSWTGSLVFDISLTTNS